MEEILHYPTCMKPCKYWDIYHHINWCRISSINSIICFLQENNSLTSFRFSGVMGFVGVCRLPICARVVCQLLILEINSSHPFSRESYYDGVLDPPPLLWGWWVYHHRKTMGVNKETAHIPCGDGKRSVESQTHSPIECRNLDCWPTWENFIFRNVLLKWIRLNNGTNITKQNYLF